MFLPSFPINRLWKPLPKIVFFSFVDKEAERLGMLAGLGPAKVAKPLHFNVDFERFKAWRKQCLHQQRRGDISEHRKVQGAGLQ